MESNPPESETETAQRLVSYVTDAYTLDTQHISPKEIFEWIRDNETSELARRIRRIREMRAEGETESARKAKNKLPAVLLSGTFRQKSKPMTDQLIEHSGLLCADLDDLGERLPELRSALAKSPNLFMMFISPSGEGLKCVFRVPADVSQHYGSFLAVQKYCKNVHGVEVDAKCSDVGRLCFLSHDPEAHLNEDAIELKPSNSAAKPKEYATLTEEESARRREIAEKISVLDDIDWEDDATGYCECPGELLHSTSNGTRLRIKLDAIPSAHCFHQSCKPLLAPINYELRSRIGKKDKAEEVVLPPTVGAQTFLTAPLYIPAELVTGLIHQNTVSSLSGGSKSAKTYALLDMAISVSTGQAWLGNDTTKGRVLFLNFEVAAAFFQRRLNTVAGARGLEVSDEWLSIKNLRGFKADVKSLIPALVRECKDEGYALLVVDPFYKILGARNENATNEIGEILGFIDELSNETGAAVIYSHHFAKGSAAAKEQIDRQSGAGVFARHADSILTLTKHEQKDCYVFEATLRNFAPMEPIVLQWDYPLFQPDKDADPGKLKGKGGRPATFTVSDLTNCLPLAGGRDNAEWQKAAEHECGIKHNTFFRLRKEAESKGMVEQDPLTKKWKRSKARNVVHMEAA
jgi:hypothetical protein